MFVLEYKVKPKPQQVQAIEEAIKTHQFVRNKVLGYWMDNRGKGKKVDWFERLILFSTRTNQKSAHSSSR